MPVNQSSSGTVYNICQMDEDDAMALIGSYGFGPGGGPSALNPVQERVFWDALDHPSPEVRKSVVKSLAWVDTGRDVFAAKLNDVACDHGHKSVLSYAFYAMEGLEDYGPVVPAFEKALSSPDRGIAFFAVMGLWGLASRKREYPDFMRKSVNLALSHVNDDIRENMLLTFLDIRSGVSVFADNLNRIANDHSDDGLSVLAFNAIGGEYDDNKDLSELEPFKDALTRGIESDNQKISLAAVRASCKYLDGKDFCPEFLHEVCVKAIESPHEATVLTVLRTLEDVKDISPFVSVLEEREFDPNRNIRDAVSDILNDPNKIKVEPKPEVFLNVRLNFTGPNGIDLDRVLSSEAGRALVGVFSVAHDGMVKAKVSYSDDADKLPDGVFDVNLPQKFQDAVSSQVAGGFDPAVTLQRNENGDFEVLGVNP